MCVGLTLETSVCVVLVSRMVFSLDRCCCLDYPGLDHSFEMIDQFSIASSLLSFIVSHHFRMFRGLYQDDLPGC